MFRLTSLYILLCHVQVNLHDPSVSAPTIKAGDMVSGTTGPSPPTAKRTSLSQGHLANPGVVELRKSSPERAAASPLPEER